MTTNPMGTRLTPDLLTKCQASTLERAALFHDPNKMLNGASPKGASPLPQEDVEEVVSTPPLEATMLVDSTLMQPLYRHTRVRQTTLMLPDPN